MKQHVVPSKERFVSPRVTQAVGLEVENEILVGSPGTDVTSTVVAQGHETESVTVGDYWE